MYSINSLLPFLGLEKLLFDHFVTIVTTQSNLLSKYILCFINSTPSHLLLLQSVMQIYIRPRQFLHNRQDATKFDRYQHLKILVTGRNTCYDIKKDTSNIKKKSKRLNRNENGRLRK